ncbi:MAG: CotH kinase family protein [Chryseolinea sp.]
MKLHQIGAILFLLVRTTGFGQVDENVIFNSSNLPIVIINTNGLTIVDDPKITADMGIIDNGTARNNVTDPYNAFSGKIGIEIRGSSSQMFPKKQWGIELRDDAGESKEASLLGMPAEEDWVLFAPYNDKTLMRDALAYALGREMGGVYAPRTRYCEVVLNNVYQGVYVLIEKIKRDKNRVDINKLDPDEVSGNNLTGGYIFKIDKSTGGDGEGWASNYPPSHASNQTIYFQYDYPKAENIVDVQKTYIQTQVKAFEDALHGDQFADPALGYAKYIDVNSFIDYFIMQELTKNVDGFRLSTFLYKQRDSDGGKIVLGPIWDFNLGFGNADYCTKGEPKGWANNFNMICPDDYWLIPFWWDRLFTDPAFGTKVASRWATLRAGAFQESAIQNRIDSLTNLLNAESQQRNFKAWKVLGQYVWPNYYVGPTFQDEVTHLKKWVSERLIWMDQNMPLLITAVESEKAKSTVSASPNPFSSDVTIDYELTRPGDVTIRILDALGRTVNHTDIPHSGPGHFAYTWTGSGAQGIYFFNVRQGPKVLGSGKLSRK